MGLLWNNDASMSRKAFNGISKIFKYDRWKFENYIKQEENYKDWEYNEKETILKNKHGLEKWYKARKKEEERKQMYSNTYGTTRSTTQHIQRHIQHTQHIQRERENNNEKMKSNVNVSKPVDSELLKLNMEGIVAKHASSSLAAVIEAKKVLNQTEEGIEKETTPSEMNVSNNNNNNHNNDTSSMSSSSSSSSSITASMNAVTKQTSATSSSSSAPSFVSSSAPSSAPSSAFASSTSSSSSSTSSSSIPSSFSSSLPPFIPIPSTAEPIRNIVKSKLLSIKEMKAFIKMDTLISTWAWNVDQAREALLALSSQLRAIKPCLSSGNDNHLHMSKKEMDIKNNGASTAQMLSDLLIMYAHTETFFVPHRYGQPRVVRTHDVAVVDVPGTSRVDLMNVPIATAEEGYGYIRTTETGVINKDSTLSSSSSSSSSTSSSSSYATNATKTSTVGFEIHDEILNWNVQSKEDYIATTSTFQSSIRMGDLGVAYLPSIASCFSKSKINYNTKYYTSTSRRTMIEHLTETPFGCWNNSYELNTLFNATENLGQNGVDKEDEEEEEEEEEEEDDVVYGSPMFDDLLSTLDSSSSLSSNPGPSTTAVLNVLKSALSKKLSTKKDDAAVEKVMAGLTIGKENSFEIFFFFLDYFH